MVFGVTDKNLRKRLFMCLIFCLCWDFGCDFFFFLLLNYPFDPFTLKADYILCRLDRI